MQQWWCRTSKCTPCPYRQVQTMLALASHTDLVQCSARIVFHKGAAAPWRGVFGVLHLSGPQASPQFERVHPGSSTTGSSCGGGFGQGAGARASGGMAAGFCELLEAVAAGEDVYVGTPGMDSLCAHLASTSGMEHAWRTKVRSLWLSAFASLPSKLLRQSHVPAGLNPYSLRLRAARGNRRCN